MRQAYFLKIFILSILISTVNTHTVSAATATTTFLVTASVNNECLVSAANLAFGVYSISSPTPTDANSTVTVTCTSGTDYTVSLNGGSTGDINARAMSGAGNPLNTLNYQLYSNAARTTVWGDGTVGSNVSGTGTGLAQAVTVYGRIPAGQAAAPDSYTDTITVTLNY